MKRNPEASRHHSLWPKRAYQSDPILREVRSRYGLIAEMDRDQHNQLHRELDPPPVLPRLAAANLILHLNHIHSSDEILASADWLYTQADRGVEEYQVLERVAHNLMQQLTYIRGGNYEAAQQLLDRRQS